VIVGATSRSHFGIAGRTNWAKGGVSLKKMRNIFTAFVLVVVLAATLVFSTACGLGTGEGDYFTDELVGAWYVGNLMQYTFNEDGTGRMFAMGNIRWATDDGVLFICITPGICRSVSRCSGPSRWYYTLDGDTLTMEGTGNLPIFGNTTHTYTRR